MTLNKIYNGSKKNTHNSNRSYGVFMTLGKYNLERLYCTYFLNYILHILTVQNFWIQNFPYEEIVGHPGFSFTCSRNIHCSFSYQLADVLVFQILCHGVASPPVRLYIYRDATWSIRKQFLETKFRIKIIKYLVNF
jgi:hypothetical protein